MDRLNLSKPSRIAQRQGEHQWEAQAATVDITPNRPYILAGNGLPGVVNSGVEDRIEANVLLLVNGDSRAVLISFDLLYVGAGLRNAILERLGDTLPRESVFFYASHTHSAPATDVTKQALGQADSTFVEYVATKVSDRICALNDAMASSKHSASLELRVGNSPLGVNRRRPWLLQVSRKGLRFRGVVKGAHARGAVDKTISVLTVRSEDGAVVAVLWSWACHPVAHPAPRLISAHFPGRARAHLRKDFGRHDLPILFLQGFSGDIRPDSQSTNASRNSGLRRLLQGPGYGEFTRDDYETWCDSVAQCLRMVMASTPRDLKGALSARTEYFPRKDFVTAATVSAPVEFRALDVGAELVIVSVGAEVVNEYGRWLRGVFPHQHVVPVGCEGDVFGYAPTAAMLKEGGYESEGFCTAFECAGVNPNIEYTMKRALESVC